MALMSYKCPNCGGGLVFDPDSQKFQCEYCLSEFTEEEMKQMEEASASPAEEEEAVPEEEGTAPQEGDSSQSPETGEAAVYTCPNCGAQIVTDATTAAILSNVLVQHVQKNNQLLFFKLNSPYAVRDAFICYRKNRYTSAAMKKFIEYLTGP